MLLREINKRCGWSNFVPPSAFPYGGNIYQAFAPVVPPPNIYALWFCYVTTTHQVYFWNVNTQQWVVNGVNTGVGAPTSQTQGILYYNQTDDTLWAFNASTQTWNQLV